MPAGKPMLTISFSVGISRCSLFHSSLIIESVFSNKRSRIKAETALANTVAIAIPVTSSLHMQTKNKSSTILTRLAAISAINGFCVSPILRKIAASKLYSKIIGIPKKYILRYITADGKTSAGISNKPKIGTTANCAKTATAIPIISERSTAVCTAFFTPSVSRLPIDCAMTTLEPKARPKNRKIIIPIIGKSVPTAAMAAVLSLLAKLPAMTTSVAVKNCSKIAVAATGIENLNILSHKEPLSMSMLVRISSIPSLSFS